MISLIFRFINFGVIIALLLYAFRRYGLPRILHQIEANKRYQDNLDSERAELDVAQIALDKQMHAQEQHCVSLSQKIDQWNRVVLSDLRQKEIQAQDTMQITQERRKRQSAQYTIEKTRAVLSRCIENKLKEELIAYFADEKVAQKYLQHTLSSIEKR
jgi:hypothetical protein